DLFGLPYDLAHDIPRRPDVMHQAAGLAGPEGYGVQVTLEVAQGDRGLVLEDIPGLAQERPGAQHRALARPLSAGRSAGSLPLPHHPVADHPVGSVGPTHVE